jgi:hypothetical protein
MGGFIGFHRPLRHPGFLDTIISRRNLCILEPRTQNPLIANPLEPYYHGDVEQSRFTW